MTCCEHCADEVTVGEDGQECFCTMIFCDACFESHVVECQQE